MMIQLRKSIQLKENPLKITIDALRQKKAKNEKFASVTCYDSTFAQVSDAAGIEVLLVGDSLGMVIQGGNSTLPVTVEDIYYHTKAVASQTKNALIMSDMPFMGARTLEAGLDASMKLMQAGAHMIKLEGDASLAPLIKTLKSQGVPVCVHLGLTPQAVHSLSGFKAQAKDKDSAQVLIETAVTLEQAGADIVLVECIPAAVTKELYKAIKAPIIGIGAGPDCDGQILVGYDLLGIPAGPKARFVKNYMREAQDIAGAFTLYRDEVITGKYPAPEHCFK